MKAQQFSQAPVVACLPDRPSSIVLVYPGYHRLSGQSSIRLIFHFYARLQLGWVGRATLCMYMYVIEPVVIKSPNFMLLDVHRRKEIGLFLCANF